MLEGEEDKLSAALLPAHLLKQHSFKLWKADPIHQYHEMIFDPSAG